jgi:anti-sigma B factor antagonist
VLSVNVSVRQAGGQAVVALRGELDLASTPALVSHLTAAVAACGPAVIVDVAGLEYIGYSGLGVLVRVGKWLRESGGDLALAAPQPQVKRILVVTGLIDVFAVYPTVDAAAGATGHASPAAPNWRPSPPSDRPALLVTREDRCGRRRARPAPPRCGARYQARRRDAGCRRQRR